MNRHRVRAAIELIDVAPSIEFRATLQRAAPCRIPQTGPSRHAGVCGSERGISRSHQRVRHAQTKPVTILPGKACFEDACGDGRMRRSLGNRGGDHQQRQPRRNPDRRIARRGPPRSIAVGAACVDPWRGLGAAMVKQPELGSDRAAERGRCDDCSAAGLRPTEIRRVMPPTTKSATAYQYVSDNNLLLNQVFVFATREDASRAMNVIAGDVFPTCWFDVFDRGVEFTYRGVTSTSEEWEPPQIAQHGDRQVIIGQHTQLTLLTGPAERDPRRCIRTSRPSYHLGATRGC